ncbi:MAG: undecaprenyl/decaprenyl-phosphate alpha-N-acetylglucosaminyl 1-phosphate transferase [Clostridia bacterium]|nr:undecaprenyl/decaprenyl-phosphate alpha-N-acetylglucosaminyl 1-phosphate transferase [Clostridia bacterium]
MAFGISIIYGLVALVCAGLLSFATTPAVRVLAFKIGAIDIPKDNRRMHSKPIPRIGGLAIYFSFCVTCLFFCSFNRELIVLLAGGFLMAALGTLDDVFRLPAIVKFICQIAIGVATALGGVRIDQLMIGGNYVSLGYFSIPITVLWIVGLSNAINLIDGLDGLSCGISTISAISILGVVLLQGELSYAVIAVILIGACFGFLPFNKHPAKIFMGDTGSLFLGYTLSVISILGTFKMHAAISVLVPLFIFAVPLTDTVFAFIRRILSGKSPFSPDRGHFHHRLVDMGFTQKETVKILYSICGIFGLVALFMCDNLFPKYKLVKSIAVVVIALAIFIITFLIMKNPKTRIHTGLFDEDVENDPVEKSKILNENREDSVETEERSNEDGK